MLNRFSFSAAALLALTALVPAATARASTNPEPGGGCTGHYVTPGKPSNEDWAPGTDLTLVNCTGQKFVAVMECHPYPTLIEDSICYTVAVPSHSSVEKVIPSNRQVHKLYWR